MALIPAEFIKPIVIALAGGLFLSISNLVEDSKKSESEKIEKDAYFWLAFTFWPISSAFLCFLYLDSGNKLSSWLAFHIGLSSPLILKTLTSVAAINESAPSGAEE
ncbi:hypothetical protein [Planctobacterium marinum]|uniref:hypothetical protein n=1 Tax=Planctobacterium marinum TaxID=1631968 RepID=UPI001E574C1F|nr:hypothetical protein [Planctobacterium marinum]MCC2608000.1 hypothetical protein [Planctobacterium marinum]